VEHHLPERVPRREPGWQALQRHPSVLGHDRGVRHRPPDLAFLRLDFLPGAGIVTFPQPRLAYEDKFNSTMFEHDPLYYGTAGLSFKF